jgi:hypothetical protein
MTGQMPDKFLYKGEFYDLIGIKGEGLYTPEDFGMEPHSTCTACWRGYLNHYQCSEKEFTLEKMLVNTKDPPEINGVKPAISDRKAALERASKSEEYDQEAWDQAMFEAIYTNLHLKTKFSGTVLLGKDFIDGMYVHMGFQRPISYQTVIKFHIEEGTVVKVENISEKIKEIREANPDKDAAPDGNQSGDSIGSWIEKSFSRDTDL